LSVDTSINWLEETVLSGIQNRALLSQFAVLK
jgi:hypothetical protein